MNNLATTNTAPPTTTQQPQLFELACTAGLIVNGQVQKVKYALLDFESQKEIRSWSFQEYDLLAEEKAQAELDEFFEQFNHPWGMVDQDGNRLDIN